MRLKITELVVSTQNNSKKIRVTTQMRNVRAAPAITRVPRVVAPQISRISSHRLDKRIDRYRPNTVNKKCQTSRKIQNNSKLASFTRISKNSAKLNLPTRWNKGKVETPKAHTISSRSKSLNPFENSLRFMPMRDP